MIKHLLFAFWMCAVTLGSAYGTIIWQVQSEKSADDGHDEKPPIEQVQTKRISIPIISDGGLKGYMLAQFIFNVNGASLKELTVRPDIFFVDEVFRVIYGGGFIDFRDPKKTDISALSALIKKNVNARFGENFVQDVLVQELNYVPQERFRGGALPGDTHFA
jgi:hypothetical protein